MTEQSPYRRINTRLQPPNITESGHELTQLDQVLLCLQGSIPPFLKYFVTFLSLSLIQISILWICHIWF